MCSKLSPPGIYLLRWGGLGEGGGGVAGAARLCHGRSRRDRHEPVFVPIPQDYCGIDVECDAALTTTWNQVQQCLSAVVLNRSESSLSKQYNTAGFRAIEKDLTMEITIKQKHTWLFVSLVHHECVTQGDFMCYFGNKSSCVGMKCFKFTRRYPASIVPLSKTGLTVKHHHSSTDLFVTERKPASIVAFITSSTRKKKKILRDQNPRPFFASLQERG